MKRVRRVAVRQNGLFPDETIRLPLPPAVVSEAIRALADLLLASMNAHATDDAEGGGNESQDQR